MLKTAILFCTSLAALLISANALGADVSDAEFIEASRIEELFKKAVPKEARILDATTGSSFELVALLPAKSGKRNAPKMGMQYRISNGSTWVETQENAYAFQGANCKTPSLRAADIKFVAALRAKQQTNAIAAYLKMAGHARPFGQMVTDADCVSRWIQSIEAKESDLSAALHFDMSGRLVEFQRFENNQMTAMSKTELRALDDATKLPLERVKAKPTPAIEAADLPPFPDEGDYLQMMVNGEPWHCVSDDMSLNYDYTTVEFKCDAADGNQSFGFKVESPEVGKSFQASLSDSTSVVWMRQGDLWFGDHHADDVYTLRFTSFTAKKISAEFSADLHLAELPAIHIRNGRMRLIPSEGFRVTPP
jgi:hypothetical protein